MFRNILLITWRNFVRHKWYSLINVLGLTISLTAALLILIFISHELSYDRFHFRAEDIYRIGTRMGISGKENNWSLTLTPLGPELQRRYSYIEAYTRLRKNWSSTLLSFENKKFYESNLLYADSGFFKIFDFPVIQGNPDEFLSRPYTMVLTESMAGKYFGSEDPVGKIITMNTSDDFTITGIVEDPPANSHIRFDAIASFSTMYQGPMAKWMGSWTGNINYQTYILTEPGIDPEVLEDEILRTMLDHNDEDLEKYGITMEPVLQEMTAVHLYSDLQHDFAVTSDIMYIYIFSAIALVILVIAAINYMNLATARSARRAKEVGIRKVTGAAKRQLVLQFLAESLFFVIIAFIFTLLLTELILPIFSNLVNTPLDFTITGNPDLYLIFLLLTLIIGLLAGLYPAFYLSGFRPVQVLKSDMVKGRGGVAFRNILVLIQFFISVGLIIGTISIFNQLNYIRNKNLGYDVERVIVAPIRSDEVKQDLPTVKERLEALAGVRQVAASQNYFGHSMSGNGYQFEGQETEELHLVNSIDVDEDFVEVMELKILEGRDFSEEFSTDSMAMLLNESAVRYIGWDDPIGKTMVFNGVKGYRVVGVVEDFHYLSLRENIEPLIISNRAERFSYLNIRLEPGNLQAILDKIQALWRDIDPRRPFDYFFLDDNIAELYRQEKRLGGIFIYFTIFGVLVALLGLFGLTAYLTEQRTKEIGIRKAMGATTGRVIILLSSRFLRIVIFANILAWPVAYLLMNNWLENFAYRTSLSWWVFLLATLLSLLVAFLTVSIQSLRAASANPSEALRYE